MSTRRAHIHLPEELIEEIDQLVGPRGRSAFLVEVAQREVQRRKQLAALAGAAGSWRTAHHPELKEGAAQWVKRLRQEGEARSQAARKGQIKD